MWCEFKCIVWVTCLCVCVCMSVWYLVGYSTLSWWKYSKCKLVVFMHLGLNFIVTYWNNTKERNPVLFRLCTPKQLSYETTSTNRISHLFLAETNIWFYMIFKKLGWLTIHCILLLKLRTSGIVFDLRFFSSLRDGVKIYHNFLVGSTLYHKHFVISSRLIKIFLKFTVHRKIHTLENFNHKASV